MMMMAAWLPRLIVIALTLRGAAALVRAFRRSGDWQGALDLPVVGPLSAHAAVEACRAGADADRAVQIVEGLEAPSLALLADAAAACDSSVEAAARVWRAGVQVGLYPSPARGDDVLTVDVHAMTVPLAVGAVVGAREDRELPLHLEPPEEFVDARDDLGFRLAE